MSRTAPATAEGALREAPSACRIRRAQPADAEAVAGAVRTLLRELGASPPGEAEMLQAARDLLTDPSAGVVLLAEADDLLVGLLSVSWQIAIHAPGRYGLIQDLWVRPDHRGLAVGGALIERLAETAREARIACIEVGLPKASFQGLRATETFYLQNGFTTLGTRMRKALA